MDFELIIFTISKTQLLYNTTMNGKMQALIL